ncbi:MAG: hypothetical protein WBG32_07990, partial [Nodosilinea sp.]
MDQDLTSLTQFAGPAISLFGVALLYQRWIVQNRIEDKDDTISGLRDELSDKNIEIEGLKKELDKISKDIDESRQSLFDFIDTIEESSLSREVSIKLRKILSRATALPEETQKKLDDYRVAAEELNSLKSEAISASLEKVFHEHGNKILGIKRILPWHTAKFKRDIEKDISLYLNWVYDCLYITGHPDNNPLDRYVESPVVKCPDLYLKAINYIKEDFNWSKSNLTVKQVMLLGFMLDELLQRIPAEFNESS